MRFGRLALVCLLLPVGLHSSVPDWWTAPATRIIDPNAQKNNYSPVNLGQLKNVAKQAKEHLDLALAGFGGAGPQVDALVAGFQSDPATNYSPANLGQLKAVSKVFYDRLLQIGCDTRRNLISRGYPANWQYDYPWNPATPKSENYALANIGQLKMVFSFDLSKDSDSDGLPDWWELVMGADPLMADTHTWRVGSGMSLASMYLQAQNLAQAQSWEALQALMLANNNPAGWERRARFSLWQWQDPADGSIHLYWSGVADPATPIQIERETSPGNWGPVAQMNVGDSYLHMPPPAAIEEAGSVAVAASVSSTGAVNHRINGGVTSNESVCVVRLMKAGAQVSRHQPGFRQFDDDDPFDANGHLKPRRFYLTSTWSNRYEDSGVLYTGGQPSGEWTQTDDLDGSSHIDLGTRSAHLSDTWKNSYTSQGATNASWEKDWNRETDFTVAGMLGGRSVITEVATYTETNTWNRQSPTPGEETESTTGVYNVSSDQNFAIGVPPGEAAMTWSKDEKNTHALTPPPISRYWIKASRKGSGEPEGDLVTRTEYSDQSTPTEESEHHLVPPVYPAGTWKVTGGGRIQPDAAV